MVSAGQVALGNALNLATSVGQMRQDATNQDLESLQYGISSIQICESIETHGTGFSNAQNCLQIYQKDDGGYDTFGYDEAKADTTNYIDLLDPEQVAKLSSTLQLKGQHIGQYNFGLVNWYQPFKFKGSVTLNDDGGTTLYSKDAPITEETDHNGFPHHKVKVDNITTGPSELAIMQHNNGGAWFKFSSPFVVTEQDLKDKIDYKLQLVFNADGIVKGSAQCCGPMEGGSKPYADLTDSDARYSIEVPMIGLTPIAHRSDKKIIREKYIAHYNETYPNPFNGAESITEDFDVRIELYFLKDDPEEAVYVADIQVLYTDSTQSPIGNIYDPFFVSRTDDGEIVLKTYEQKPIFKGLRRLSAVDDSATMQIVSGGGGYCLPSDSHPSTGCSSTARDVSVTYSLVDVSEF